MFCKRQFAPLYTVSVCFGRGWVFALVLAGCVGRARPPAAPEAPGAAPLPGLPPVVSRPAGPGRIPPGIHAPRRPSFGPARLGKTA